MGKKKGSKKGSKKEKEKKKLVQDDDEDEAAPPPATADPTFDPEPPLPVGEVDFAGIARRWGWSLLSREVSDWLHGAHRASSLAVVARTPC